jgi:hypothetical protein
MKNVKTVCLIAALAGLYGCGGGGGGSASLNLASVQGVWDSASYSGTDLGTATKAVRSVMFKNGAAWLLLLDDLTTNNPTPIGLVKAAVTVSGQNFSGTGKRYMLDGSPASNVEVQGNVPASQQLALKFGAAANPTTLATLAPVTRFSTTAASADMTGSWQFQSTQATTGGGTTTVTWTWAINSAGTLSGTNTLGCTFNGQVLPHADPVAVFTVALNENCAGTTRQYSGVALQNSAKNQTTFGLTLQDQSVGTIAVAAKVIPG